MIDTDKYEGHTPAPWTPNDDGYVDADYSITQVLPFVSPKAFLANTQLIADAPLLLAEVKRLEAVKIYLREAIKVATTDLEEPNMHEETRKDLLNMLKELIE